MTNASPLLVVAAALTDTAGRVLVQQRRGGALDGLWEFPGGKVEPWETPEQALAREIREELDVVIDVSSLQPLSFASSPLGERHLVLLLYRVRRWSGEPRPLAAASLAWHHPAALTDLPMPEPDLPLVAALIASAPIG